MLGGGGGGRGRVGWWVWWSAGPVEIPWPGRPGRAGLRFVLLRDRLRRTSVGMTDGAEVPLYARRLCRLHRLGTLRQAQGGLCATREKGNGLAGVVAQPHSRGRRRSSCPTERPTAGGDAEMAKPASQAAMAAGGLATSPLYTRRLCRLHRLGTLRQAQGGLCATREEGDGPAGKGP